jgi:fumarylacetoacetase
MRKANDSKLKSWVPVENGSDFPIQNLPFGVFQTSYLHPVAGVAIGEHVLDLVHLHEHGHFDGLGLPAGIFNQRYLNAFIGLGRKKVGEVRNRISELLRHDNEELRDNLAEREIALVSMSEAEFLMPVDVPNYTDFYSSREHATNVGVLFRDPQNALLPNWLHLPVAYHGRASSIVVSGTPIRRPSGQIKSNDSTAPVFGLSRKLDFELEVGFVICKENALGVPVPLVQAEEHIVGMVLFNDWSARDIQQWEYQPLGPFLGKNFGSTISPWIVTLDALEPFRTEGAAQEPSPLPYLKQKGKKNFDINLEVELIAGSGQRQQLSKSNHKYLYWSIAQQLAHHTVNGCNMEIGDICASGTISGPTPDSLGSLLEITKNAKEPVTLADGSSRTFLEDNDEVILRGFAEKNGVRIGFGECRGKVVSQAR